MGEGYFVGIIFLINIIIIYFIKIILFLGEIDALLNNGDKGKLTTTLISLKPTEALLIDKTHLIHFFKKNLGILLKLNYLKYFGPI